MAVAAPRGKEVLDPEVILHKKFKAKCQFRALGRLVMDNAYWLIEGVEHYEGDDVKRRVEQAVRSKSKKKQLLSINDKAILNKPAEERTESERKYLYRIIGGLKCFKRYPNNVKKKLAAAMYFKYYGPGRVVVRQHHEAHALYFIVTGDVIVSQLILDELLNKYVEVEVGQMHAGDMFGEVSLLHNIKRTATCTTAGHCEFLALIKDDFKNVLQASLQKQWDDVLFAMSSFTYFDCLDEVSRREGCIVAKMKSYEPDEIMYGEGAGLHNYVYFVLSGRCQMIESLQVTITKRLDKTYYTLYEPFVLPREESEHDLEKKYFTKTSDTHDSTSFGIKSDGSEKNSRNAGSILKTAGILPKAKQDSVQISEFSEQTGEPKQSIETESKVLLHMSDYTRESIRYSAIALEPPTKVEPTNIRTFFMQVCQLSAGATFGFSENMRDRRIVALTRVDCMLLPLVWLLQRNTANIWSRIKHFLEKKIPSKRELFNTFVFQRRWQEYRDQVVEDVLKRSHRTNTTTIHDVPYSIRMEEMLQK